MIGYQKTAASMNFVVQWLVVQHVMRVACGQLTAGAILLSGCFCSAAAYTACCQTFILDRAWLQRQQVEQVGVRYASFVFCPWCFVSHQSHGLNEFQKLGSLLPELCTTFMRMVQGEHRSFESSLKSFLIVYVTVWVFQIHQLQKSFHSFSLLISFRVLLSLNHSILR